jgi:hypothetical protein
VEKTKRKYSKWKFYLCFAVVVAALAGISHLWGLSPLKQIVPLTDASTAEKHTPQSQSDSSPVLGAQFEEEEEEEEEEIQTPLSQDDSFPIMGEQLEVDDSANGVFFSRKVWSYPECFNDSNATQLVAAERNGIKPAETRERVMELVGQGRLTYIASSPYYIVEDLTHSMPYLVPKAQLLLNTIGINFVDSLHSKGYDLHLPVVTSVLRTGHDVERLQQGNVNSVTNSCHCYGTTIDITYNRFMPLKGNSPTRYDDNLKKVLAEVLFDLKAEGLCYVKYERLQACFHLTVR